MSNFKHWPRKQLKKLAVEARRKAGKNGTVHKFTKEESERNNLAAQSPARRRKIARKGGRASQAKGRAHLWTTSVQARRAALLKGKFLQVLLKDVPPPVKKSITVKETAEYLGLSARTVFNCLSDGRLVRANSKYGRRITTVSAINLRSRYQREIS